MRYLSGIGATVALFALAVPTGAETLTKGSAGSDQPQMLRSQKNIRPSRRSVMKDQTFHIAKGKTAKGFMLLAGSRADIVLRNEDTVAHEFVLNAFQCPISARW